MLKQLPFFTAMDLENVFDYHITNSKLSYLSKKKNMLNLNELNISVRKLIWTESHFILTISESQPQQERGWLVYTREGFSVRKAGITLLNKYIVMLSIFTSGYM